MNQINFLPDSFAKTLRRRQRRPVEFAVIAMTVAGLILLWLNTESVDPALAKHLKQVTQAERTLAKHHTEEERLKQKRADLARQLRIERETGQPILMTQILSRLSTHMPLPIQLTSLQLIANRPKATPTQPQKSADQPRKKTRRAYKKQTPQPQANNRIKIVLAGIAPSDTQIVELIRRLENDPIFSGVSLRNSRMEKTQTHYTREFEIDVDIDLNRRFVAPAPARGDHHEN